MVIGVNNTVDANFYAPNGTLLIRQKSEVTGALIGRDVSVGTGTSVALDSAF